MDLQPLVGDCYARLASALESSGSEAWDQPSLCVGWRVREVVAHVTMPATLTAEQFAAEMAATGGDFQALSDNVASRGGPLPVTDHLVNLRSPVLAGWQPPGGGAIGALTHAVVHGLDITNALQLPAACPSAAAMVVLRYLTAEGGAAHFDVDLSPFRLEATDEDWTWGHGRPVVATIAQLISLITHRTLLDGRGLD